MKLNCKPGDLAIKIKADPIDSIPIGSILICKDFRVAINAKTKEVLQAWLVEYQGNTRAPSGFPWHCKDEYLRPIRDQPGEDETLTWAPVPHKETV